MLRAPADDHDRNQRQRHADERDERRVFAVQQTPRDREHAAPHGAERRDNAHAADGKPPEQEPERGDTDHAGDRR